MVTSVEAEAAAPFHTDVLAYDAGFGITDIARLTGIPRTVQSVIQSAGSTWSSWALRERLQIAGERISDPAWAHRTVEGIDRSSGIPDALA